VRNSAYKLKYGYTSNQHGTPRIGHTPQGLTCENNQISILHFCIINFELHKQFPLNIY